MASEATTGVVIVSVIESARALIALDARERRRVPEQRREPLHHRLGRLARRAEDAAREGGVRAARDGEGEEAPSSSSSVAAQPAVKARARESVARQARVGIEGNPSVVCPAYNHVWRQCGIRARTRRTLRLRALGRVIDAIT